MKNATVTKIRLVPKGKKRCSGRELVEALARTELSTDEARDWNRDLKAARESIKTPSDKWQ